jgi:transcriptional regulator with XRE-family HTH domain
LKKRRDNNILIACGSNIKRYRKALNLSQEEVSARIDMDFSQYGKIERGLTNITLSTLSEIAIVLNVEPRDLLT